MPPQRSLPPSTFTSGTASLRLPCGTPPCWRWRSEPSRRYPGRVTLGIGHGVQEWMAQIGERVASPLTLLEEVVTAVRSLLHGRRMTTEGRYISLREVELVFPPALAPDVVCGVTGPKSISLSGRIGDGTVLGEGTTPQAVRDTRTRIADPAHRISVFFQVETATEVRREITELFAAGADAVILRPSESLDDPTALAARADLAPPTSRPTESAG
ncbi:MAG: LLM class flavin-dependent oxidoreductase [Ilumatobacteraceae bacterium]